MKRKSLTIAVQLYEICIEAAHYFGCDLCYLMSHFKMSLSQDVFFHFRYYVEHCSPSDIIMSQLRSVEMYVYEDKDQADDGMVVIEPKKQYFKANIADRISKVST